MFLAPSFLMLAPPLPMLNVGTDNSSWNNGSHCTTRIRLVYGHVSHSCFGYYPNASHQRRLEQKI